MTKEILQDKIIKLLEIDDDKKQLAFNTFKNKVLEKLEVGEAIKISDVGIFQLKEQLKYNDDSSESEKIKGLALVYSPEDKSSSEDFLFLNIAVDEKLKDSENFDENVFQLGVDKPLVTSEDATAPKSDSPEDELNNKVDEVLSKSEKLEHFDLWDNYLTEKESTTIIDDNTDIEDIVEDKIEVSVENLTEEAIEKVNEVTGNIEKISNEVEENIEEVITEDVFEDLMDEDETNLEQNSTKEVDSIDEEKLNADKDILKLDDEFEDIETDEIILDDNDEPVISNLDNKEIEEEISVDDIEVEEISKVEEDIKIDEDDVELKELNLNDDDLDLNIDDEDILEKENEFEEEYQKEERKIQEAETKVEAGEEKGKNKLWFFLLLGLLLLAILGGAYYYLFHMNAETPPRNKQPENSYVADAEKKENETKPVDVEKVENTEAKETPAEEKVQDSKVQDEKITKSNEKVVETKKEEPVKPVETPAKKEETKTQNISNSNKEEEVSDNIYSNGKIFNIQLSSWKNIKIAEKEVARLKKKGYPAFIMKVYIEKFGDTWNRVRVGPYNSLEKAKKIQKKIK